MNLIRVQILTITVLGLIGSGVGFTRLQSIEQTVRQLRSELSLSFTTQQFVRDLDRIQPGALSHNRIRALGKSRPRERSRNLFERLAASHSELNVQPVQTKWAAYRQVQNEILKEESELTQSLIQRIDRLSDDSFRWLTFSLGSALAALLWVVAVSFTKVFRIIKRLNRRMMDFLLDRYSFQFSNPESNELGDLQRTFNALAQRVINTTDELKRLDQAKSEFLSIASHELRTPMTSIKGSLSLLAALHQVRRPQTANGVKSSEPYEQNSESSKSDDKVARLLTIAATETDRMIRLINDLLDLAKIEAGGLPLKLEWTSWTELAKKILDGVFGLSSQARIEIRVVTSAQVELRVDRDRMQQILTNLVSNAVKFSPQGSSITLWLSQTQDGQLRINVTDQGHDIRPEDQSLIFEKFRQGSNPENPLVKGTGLGLAIVRALVVEHGGTIGVESELGHGATFWFTLPQWRVGPTTVVEKAKLGFDSSQGPPPPLRNVA